MNRIKLVIIAAILFLGIAWVWKMHREPQERPVAEQTNPPPFEEKIPEVVPPVPPKEEPPKTVEPEWTDWPAVRSVNNPSLGKVLQDIDSHMPAGHIYRDGNKVTWAHETTHGINSNIRNKHQDATRVNGFYGLNNRACVIYEPKTTIRAIAPKVPQVLRGPSYNLYLVQQTSGWNDRPLYLFDEWVAYTNGSECGRELNHSGWYYELLQAHNFNVYCIYLAMTVKEKCPDYDDKQMKAFMMWNIERTFRLAAPTVTKREIMYPDPNEVKQHHLLNPMYPPDILPHGADDSDPTREALAYVEKVRTAPEAESLRTFARQYFGAEWCKRVYGF